MIEGEGVRCGRKVWTDVTCAPCAPVYILPHARERPTHEARGSIPYGGHIRGRNIRWKYPLVAFSQGPQHRTAYRGAPRHSTSASIAASNGRGTCDFTLPSPGAPSGKNIGSVNPSGDYRGRCRMTGEHLL
ncbi:hypothetical protein B0T14DRAFT_246548 [Immersiella caudata]|uniref:Uncharacterized protein n=1 Tax=Immersiella caudata TaxID=314043 RepID=A0AA40BWQ2_9PEZI|nr:hypothetical protein B0T14DRAFT_246548 [Immersiella caudata]